MLPLKEISTDTSLIAFVLGVPTVIATYYQAWKARREAQEARDGLLYSKNCLEFITDDGHSVNLVPLETLHTLPKPGDIVLLPGSGEGYMGGPHMGAYRVGRIEHIYGRIEGRKVDPKQARLIKAVAHVQGLLEEVQYDKSA